MTDSEAVHSGNQLPCLRCKIVPRGKDIYWEMRDVHFVVCYDCAAQIVTEWVNSEVEMSPELKDKYAGT